MALGNVRVCILSPLSPLSIAGMSSRNSNPSNHFPLWATVAQSKRAARDAEIPLAWQLRPDQVPDDQLDVTAVPAECGILTDREVEITETDVTVLTQKLLDRHYSSHEVSGVAIGAIEC